MDLAWDQIVSLCGAFLILLAYGTQSLKSGGMNQLLYQILNALGAGALCFTAILHRQYGFIVLEGTWVIISLYALGKMAWSAAKKN